MHNEIRKFKEKFKISKIAGLMMLHYFKWPWCLEDLAAYVDEIYLLLHYSPEYKANWPKSITAVKGYKEISFAEELSRVEFRQRGNREKFREMTVRILDPVRPDLVFFPDEDEAFPEPDLLVRDLKRFVRSKNGQLAFRRTNFWDSMETVRKDRWIHYHGPHVRIFKWQPNLTYFPYLGFNRVTTHGKRRMLARTVMKHYAFLEKEERERRFHILFRGQEKNYKKLLEKPKLVKYKNALKAPRT